MAKVNGSSLFVTVGLNRVAKSTSYELSAEMGQLDKTSNESGFFADHISRLASWSLSSESLYIQDGFSFGDLSLTSIVSAFICQLGKKTI